MRAKIGLLSLALLAFGTGWRQRGAGKNSRRLGGAGGELDLDLAR